jgi:hypothetical protein
MSENKQTKSTQYACNMMQHILSMTTVHKSYIESVQKH